MRDVLWDPDGARVGDTVRVTYEGVLLRRKRDEDEENDDDSTVITVEWAKDHTVTLCPETYGGVVRITRRRPTTTDDPVGTVRRVRNGDVFVKVRPDEWRRLLLEAGESLRVHDTDLEKVGSWVTGTVTGSPAAEATVTTREEQG